MSHRSKVRSRSTLSLALLVVLLLVAALAVAAPAFADQQPGIWVTPVTVAEGDTGQTSAVFTVHRNPGAVDRTTITYRTGNLSATAPSDYTETVGQLVMAPGFDEATVRVPVVGDTRPEGDETFQLIIASPSGARITDGDAIATVLDDDRLPGLSIGDSTVTEGDTGTVDAVFPVSLDRPSAQPVRVRYATSDFGSATPGRDFVATSGTLTIPAGNTSATITVKVKGDTVDERGNGIDHGVSESFYVGLSDPVNATVLDTTTLSGGGFGRILDDDKPPYLRVLDDGQVEGGTEVFRVQLSGPAKNTVTAFWDATSYDTSIIPNQSGVFIFAPGETSKTVSVKTVGDCIDQGTGRRAISFDLSDVTGAILQDSHAWGDVFNDDETLDPPRCGTRITRGAIYVAPASVVETDTGTALKFTIYGRAVNDGGTLHYATRAFGATAGADFTPVSGSAAAGATTVVTVPIVGDDLQENDEYLYLDVQRDGSNAADDHAIGDAYIIDDDVAPLVSVSDASVVEGDAGTTSDVAVEISLAAPSGAPSTVRWETREGNADDPTDYPFASGTASFQPGETTQVVHLTVNGDAVDEPDERFTVFLYDDFPAANAARSDNAGVVVILDDDRTPSISVNSPTFTEGTTGTAPAHFTVTLSQPSALPVTVAYATGDESAIAPGDYTAASGTLTFAPGETSKDVDVTLQSDTVAEATEYFDLRLTSPTNAVLESNGSNLFGYLNVLDDDVVPVITVGEVSAVEPDSGTSPLVFTVALSQGSANTVTVNYTTGDNGAVAPGDYTPTSGTLSFAPGATSRTVAVPVVGDTLTENDENFRLVLSSPSGAVVRDSSTYGTIRDNDALPNLAVGDAATIEGNSGTHNGTFVVTLRPASVNTVTVGYSTFDSNARAGEDYVSTSGTLTFAPGETAKAVNVPVNGDTVDENDEQFGLGLQTPVNAAIADGSGVLRLFDDDPTGGGAMVTVDDATVLEPDTGGVDVPVTVRLTPAATSTVQVRYRVVENTATGGDDFTPQSGLLTFAAGQTTARITVRVLGDVADESDEQAAVQLFGLSGPPNTVYGETQAPLVILDNDRSPLVSIDDLAVDEGGAGNTVDAAMTVRLHQPSALPVSVDWQTTNGNATASADYVDTGGTVTFAPGETVQTVHVTVLGDGIVEGDEYVNVAISRPVNALLTSADSQAPLVIVDSDAHDVVGAVTDPDGTGVNRVTVRVTGNNRPPRSTITAADGSFSVADLPDGQYRFAPAAAGRTFVPAFSTVDVRGGTVGGVTFIAVTAPSIGGRVVDAAGNPAAGITVTRRGNGQPDATTVTNGAGYYAFGANQPGTYTVRPTLRGATFTPTQRSVTVAAGGAATADFTQRASA